jgi:type II secretory pathway pseudopilin PulG
MTRVIASRLKSESGFGLIELLIAMVILQIALLGIVAVFSSGAVAMGKASKLGTASVLADRQMEQYRGLTYGAIGLLTTGSTDGTYTGDAACKSGTYTCGNSQAWNGSTQNSCASNPASPGPLSPGGPDPCAMKQTVTGADGKSYRIDTYVTTYTAPTPANGGSAPRPGKLVTVVVRDPSTQGANRALVRESASFDCSTGGGVSYNNSGVGC